MKNILIKSIALSAISSSILLASGWRIPEQSSTSVALSGAYIANSSGAESSYFNPANMSFNPNQNQFEADLTYIHLTSIDYKDNVTATKNGDSKKENFFVPTMFFSSQAKDNLRYGFSITAPGGLSKRWDEAYPEMFAKEFTLKIVEFNPTVSYKVSDKLALAGGLRVIYSEGIVKSDGTAAGKPVIRDMEGNTIEYGYNIALAFKPTTQTNLSLTYRSNVDLKEEGNAKLYLSGTKVYDGGTSVTVPLPAVLAIACSYKFDTTTVELEYDKTYWSEYENLDFEYDSAIPAVLKPNFDDPQTRNWKDTTAYRIGITHKVNDKLEMLVGYAKDENPAPTKHLGFELPDSDATLYSIGANYKLSKNRTVGIGYLIDIKDDRTVTNNDQGIDGKFTNAKAHLLSVGYKVDF